MCAYIAMVYIALAYVLTAYVVMAYIVVVYVVVAYTVVAYTVMTCTVMAYTVMSHIGLIMYIVMAYIVHHCRKEMLHIDAHLHLPQFPLASLLAAALRTALLRLHLIVLDMCCSRAQCFHVLNGVAHGQRLSQ